MHSYYLSSLAVLTIYVYDAHITGTCISSWATYQCLCPEERSGRDCSKKIGPSSSFYGIGYLKYATSLDAVGKPWYNSFSFRTTTDYKLIMRVELEQGKTVEYKVVYSS